MAWLLLATFLAFAPQDKKVPVPDPSALKEAETLLRSVFKEEFAKKSLPDRLALAQKLYKQGSETMDDPASRYVLLREAKDLLLGAGDFDGATRAVDEIARSFEGDVSPWKSAILAAASKAAKTPEECARLAKSWMALADEAAGAEQFAAAEKAAQEASAIAKKGKDISLVAKADAKAKDIAERKAKAEELKKARETLATRPDDAAANLQVGRHECFALGNWEKGVAMLARSSDPALKELAARDLAAPEDAAAQVAVGDGWWDLAEKESGERQERIRSRARVWYAKALGRLSGLQRVKVAKRVGDAFAAQFPGEWIDITNPNLFGRVGQAGDPIVLVPPDERQSRRADLLKPPPGEFDGVSVRMQYPTEPKKVAGYVAVENYGIAAYFDPTINAFGVVRVDVQKNFWVKERVITVTPRQTFVITIVIDGADYVFYLDGKEITRWKVATGKVSPITLQAQGGTITFDQLKLRVKP